MSEVTLRLNDNGEGGFFIFDGEEQLGEMIVSITGNQLTVYHTEVSAKAEGKGFAKLLLNAMTDYVRANELKVIPICPYVHLQFRRHPDEYADIWLKDKSERK